MRGIVVLVSLSLALLAGALPSVASAQDSAERAHALYEQGALPEALTAYRQALEEGHHATAAVATIHWHLGVLSTITGAEAEARRAFERALALDPSLRIPDELPPQGQTVYRELQREAQRMEIRLRTPEAHSDRSTSVEFSLHHAPDDFAWEVRVESAPEGSAPWSSTTSASRGAIDVPAAAWRGSPSIALRVVVLDRHGNELTRAQTTLRADSVVADGPLPLDEDEDEDEGGGVASSPWFWTGITAVVLGAVLTGLLVSRGGDSYEGGDINIVRRP